MKFGQRYIIFFVIIILAISGILLFVWRDSVFKNLYVSSGLEQTELLGQTLINNINTKDDLDASVLDNAKFLVLKKNNQHFDYNLICQDAATVSNSREASSLAPLCAIGNGSPFPRAGAQKK